MFRELFSFLRGSGRPGGPRRRARTATGYRPGLLHLESRELLSVSWLRPVGGDWDDPANWAGGRVPNSNDDVVIPFAHIQITHDRSITDSIRSLHSEAAIEVSAGSLTINPSGTPSQIDDLFTVFGGGTVSLRGVTLNGTGTLVDSGIVNLGGSTINVALQDQSILNVTDSVINNNADRPFTFNGPSAFLHVTTGDLSSQTAFANAFTNTTRILVEGVLVIDNGTLVNAPDATITLAGSIDANLDNQGTIHGVGNIGRMGGTVTNEGTIVSGPPSSSFNTGITVFQSAFTNNNTVSIADSHSTFAVQGGAFENDGSIAGPGTLSLQGITTTITPEQADAVGSLSVRNCTITSSAPLTNLVSITGSTINADVVANQNLTVAASTSFGFGTFGDTTINGNLTIAAGVTVSIAGGVDQEETLTVTQDLMNSGSIVLTGGGGGFTATDATLTVSGTLFNQSGASIATDAGVWDGTGGARVLNAALVNQGTLMIDQGTNLTGILVNNGTIAVRGDDLTVNLTNPTLFVNTGTINVSSLRSLIVENGDFTNSGTVNLTGFGGLVMTGTYMQTAGSTQLSSGLLSAGLVDLEGGTLSGSGVINADVVNNAVLNVGQAGSPGVLTIVGNYTQTSGGVLVIEIDGRTAGSFDQLNITGQATLDGTLTVIKGFQPDSGESFQVLNFGSRTGTFAILNGDGSAFDPRYNDTNLILVAN
jgi:hypothetical protein